MEPILFEKIANAPKPDFGDILTRSFELFKKVWQECLKHGLITIAVAIPIIILVYAPFAPMYIEMIDASINGHYYEPELDFPPVMIVVYIIVIFLVTFLMQVVSLAITAHFYKVCQREDTGQPIEVGGYFTYMRSYFGKMLLLSLATMGIALAAALLCYLPIFYVMVPLQLIAPIFAFNKKLSAGAIIRASFKLGNRFWLIIFGLIILSSIMAQLGILVCFIGVFVTAFFVHIPMYYLYKDTIGFENDTVPTDLNQG